MKITEQSKYGLAVLSFFGILAYLFSKEALLILYILLCFALIIIVQGKQSSHPKNL